MSALGEVIRRLGVFLCIDHLSVIWMDADSAVLYLIHCRHLLLLTLCQSPWSSQLDIHSWYDTYSLSNLQMNTPVCSGSNFEWHFWSQWHEFYLYTLGEQCQRQIRKNDGKNTLKQTKRNHNLFTNKHMSHVTKAARIKVFFIPKNQSLGSFPKFRIDPTAFLN